MSEIASKSFGSVLIGGVFAGFIYGVALWPALGAESTSRPNFAPSNTTGWLAQDDEFIPPPSGPGPVVSDPAHPYISFYKWPQNPHPTFRVADLTNPILQPWTRERLKTANEFPCPVASSRFRRSGATPSAFRPSCCCRRPRSISCRRRKRSR